MYIFNKIKQTYNTSSIQVKAVLWFFICSFCQKSIQILTTPIFTRLLTPIEFGQISVFYSWLNIFTIIFSLSLYGGLYEQGLIKFSDDKDTFSLSLQGLMTSLVLFWILIYLLSVEFWNYIFSFSTTHMMSIFIIIWTSSIFNFWAVEQRVKCQYKKLITLSLIVAILNPFLRIIIILLKSDNNITAQIIGIAILNMVAYVWIYAFQILRKKIFFSKKYWKYALVYNIPLVPHYLSQIILNCADRIMISNMIGPGEAGIYTLAYSVAMIMTILNAALMQALGPSLYKAIKNKDYNVMSQVAYKSLILIAMLNIFLIIIAPEAVRFFAPPIYFEAIWIIPPVAMSSYFMFSYDLFAKFAFYYEKTFFVMSASIFGAILNIVLNFIFIRMFGYIAAGYTTLACYIFYVIGHYYYMCKVCDRYCSSVRPYNLKILLYITVNFGVCACIMLLVYKHNILRYSIILCIIMVAIYMYKNKKLIRVKSMIWEGMLKNHIFK